MTAQKAPIFTTEFGELYCGHVLHILHGLQDESVQCVVTSPPYWRLRDYKIEPQEWDDGWVGSLGLEPTPELYVSHIVQVFREVKRVLRKDGTLWLNLGDSYAGGGRQAGVKNENDRWNIPKSVIPIGLKPKDLCGIPWRVARALQAPYYTGSIKNIEDRIWLAAMIDGEGCMFIHKRKVGQSNGQGYERKHDSYGAGLEVANVHLSIIERCQQITGMGSICRVERESKNKHRNIPLYRWNMRSNQCRDIVKEIYPYLVGKQHEARILLGCPSSGPDAEKAHYSLMALHNGKEATIDFPAPESLYEPGWYLRSDIIWSKNNPMPESVKDRPTRSHEYLFLLTKSKTYYFDQDAVKLPASLDTHARYARGRSDHHKWADGGPGDQTIAKTFDHMAGVNPKATHGVIGREKQNPSFSNACKDVVGERNIRTVWTIPTEPFSGAHFATFPRKLVEPCVKAGCPGGGVVLDPFFGAGTVGLVAESLGRHWIGIELSGEYCELAKKRIIEKQWGPQDEKQENWIQQGFF